MNPAPAHSKTTSTQRPRRSPVRIAISTLLWAVTACVVVIMAARFAPSALSNGRLIPEAAAFIPWLALLSVLVLIIAALTRRKVLSAVTVLCLVCQIVWHVGFFLPAPRIAEEAVEAVPEQTTPRDTVMRVMTLNTKNGNADAEQIVSIVRDQHVEVLAMQEVSGSLIERLSAAGLDELLPSRVIGLAGAGDNGGVNVIYTLAPMRNASESTDRNRIIAYSQVRLLSPLPISTLEIEAMSPLSACTRLTPSSPPTIDTFTGVLP